MRQSRLLRAHRLRHTVMAWLRELRLHVFSTYSPRVLHISGVFMLLLVCLQTQTNLLASDVERCAFSFQCS